jgi:hypothetical protein
MVAIWCAVAVVAGPGLAFRDPQSRQGPGNLLRMQLLPTNTTCTLERLTNTRHIGVLQNYYTG